MKIDLYLDGNIVEINKDIDFVLNKQYTDLTDLTSIIVDYSKTIKVPMTPHNNELFNYVYKLEHQVLINEDIITYDPSKKIPMTMTFNGSVVMDGYAILNSVNLKDKTYEINLYGQLGSIFSEMKEKPLKDYHREGNGWWSSIIMNTLAIHKSIHNNPHSLDWSSNDWTDFWGYAPQMIGKTDTIDTSSYDVHNGDVLKFVDTINTTRGITYADIYVKDGFDINQYPEVRSYMTRPYVYVDKIIQLVQSEINNMDFNGYQMVLDPDWFNTDNPYYRRLCWFPGNESIVDSGEGVNGFVNWDNTEGTLTWPQVILPNVVSQDLDGYTYSTAGGWISIQSSSSESPSASISLNADGVIVRDRVTGVGNTSGFNTDGRWAFYNLPKQNEVPLRYIGIYDGDDSLIYKLYLCDDTIHTVIKQSAFLQWSWGHYEYNGVWSKLKKMNSKNIVPNSCAWSNGSSMNNYCEVTQSYNFGNVVLPTNTFTMKFGCDVIDLSMGRMVSEGIAFSDYHSLCPFKNDKYKDEVWNNGASWSSYYRPIQSLNVSSNTYRSGSVWTIQDVLGKDFNPFKWLIDYVKRFRLFFDIDYMTKTITLKSGYFDDITYKKVTVDYSKDVIIDPIIDEYYTVDYGYSSNKSKKGAQYLNNYGVEYGDMKIDTLLRINTEKLSLSPNKDDSVFIPLDTSCISWITLNSTDPITYTRPLITNKVINTLNKDGEIEYYPFFAFRDANKSTDGHSRPFYYISDDSPAQKNSGEYTYLDHDSGWDEELEATIGGENVYYLYHENLIPQFDNHMAKSRSSSRDIYWCTFGVPAEVYNGNLQSNLEHICIYNRWRNYLNELFNIHNKKVTCYVRMSYPDFINFKFNQLFVIDNNVFLVNKIIDFNPNSTAPTKVELIQISDVNNLK